MNFKPNPFSLYDFLGYFTPGALFAYALFLLEPHVASKAGLSIAAGAGLTFEHIQLYVPFVLFSYVLGHLLSYTSSVIVEKYSIWSLGYPSKYLLGIPVYGFFEVGNNPGKSLRIISRLVFGLILMPISIFDAVVLRLFSGRDMIGRPLDPLLSKIVRTNVEKLLRRKSGVPEPEGYGSPVATDYFRFAYHFAVENCPNHFAKMQNYVALYGLMRTLTIVAVIFWWVAFVHLLWTGPVLLVMVPTLLLAALSILLYLSFIKFYRRFNLEVYMAISTCSAIEA